jgi:ribosomal protein S18 acetylase RimI-like enzyme
MFSSEAAYKKGWITVATIGNEIVGFVCVRHKVREPVTSLYFLGVIPRARRAGIGTALLRDLQERSPHRCVRLNVAKDNAPALTFWRKCGFVVVGDSLEGAGHALELRW